MNMIETTENDSLKDTAIQNEENKVETSNQVEIASKKSQLQRAGTMDVTALEGISILHREGVSVESTVDHLRSGAEFKSSTKAEPDSTHKKDSEMASNAENISDNQTAKTDDADGIIENGKEQEKDTPKEQQSTEPVSSSLDEKTEIESKRERMQRTLTMAATMEEAKEILKNEDLGKTRSKDVEAVTEEVEETVEAEEKKKRGSLERTLTMAATLEESKEILAGSDLGKTRSHDPIPDSSTDEEIKTPIRKTLTMLATIEEGQSVLGSENLGKTRSQDRKRVFKRASKSPRTTPSRESTASPSSAKRKRR